MQLKELIKGLEPRELIRFDDVPVKGIAYDSRKVDSGFVFVCISGLREDGHRFVGDALRRGAHAVVCETLVESDPKVPLIVVRDSREALSHISSAFYQSPSAKMRVTGITGTNGKTSTCYLCEAIIKEVGESCGIIGTINYRWGDRVLPAERTTPESLDTQRILREMYEGGCRHVFMEVSSHALDQHRVDDVRFRTAIFTNLSLDHLDYHGTLEKYLKVKVKLFKSLGEEDASIVNADDPRSSEVVRCSAARLLTYGIEKKADVMAHGVSLSPEGIGFVAQSPCGEIDIKMKLLGRGNVYNALAAISFGISQGIEPGEIKAALGKAKTIKGRFEVVEWGGDFTVVVDYAHTPQALEILLESARSITAGRVITVFGCGGDRDRSKRSLMGKASARASDISFITTDNPRSEDPVQIASEIESGFRETGAGNYSIVIDRKNAIREAIAAARCGDIVIIAGKGHETYQVLRDTVVPFDDYEVAREMLESLGA
jgi:UDP-N-acetylmuramoyl-L-alanyl-D-glutamate--2,6-diaminopimelate ligase